FTQPVDEKEVPGYRTVIQQPMDLGTMKDKVDQGLYTAIGQFREDFNLVTGNAKRFNPPDSIFHQQAVKLE
ncbi:Bromodomain-containing protein, partial [Microstroma glucosiphilum]